MIKSVTICSSSKFYDTAQRAEETLLSLGLTVYTPRYDYNEQRVQVGESDKKRLTHEFLAKIDKSDAVFVIANGGYAGVSVCIEVGYAAGQGKKVFFSELPTEFALRALVDAVVPVDEIRTEMPYASQGS
ncbi:MAG TPA: nucleoside 2-deoxyribosyltransferase [Micromonospora sp.]